MALTPAPGSSTSSTQPMKYDVYLSFAGMDTRRNFTAHLYSALQRKGIVTFWDQKLERGDAITTQLVQAIEQSRIFIVVLSQNYASSSWCLDELRMIMESQKKLGKTVFPVFYYVEPYDVRRQRGKVARDFEEHERRFSNDKIQSWRAALTEVADIAGWLVKDKPETEVIECIAEFVWGKLFTRAPGTSASSTQPMKYDVYLNFRGMDTRRNFTAYLYSALQRKGIVTFWDEKLERGVAIESQFIRAIGQCRFFIIVLSQNYTYSSWCLDELWMIIMESRKNLGKTVVPVFYDVDPSDIRRQRGNVGKPFEEYEKRLSDDKDKVQRWREALTNVANLSGFVLGTEREPEVIERIVQSVWDKLCDKLPSDFEHLVRDIESKVDKSPSDFEHLVEDIESSVESKVDKLPSGLEHLVGDIESKVHRISSLLKIGSDEKCFIGIWGMGGIGKTTLARLVYDAVRGKFDASCFLTNVRENSEKHGLVYLQKKLLSNIGLGEPKINDSFHGAEVMRNFLHQKGVLLVLDDVSNVSQLEKLAGDKKWFGVGSKIIITTRDGHLLTQCGFQKYGVGTLDGAKSLKLLCQIAFDQDEPKQGYLDLSQEVVEYCDGLPLALKVLGHHLRGREKHEWRNIFDSLKQNLPEDILRSLRISYDELDDEGKTIFLDIACFFNKKDKFKVTNILEVCGLHPRIGMQILADKSLLSFCLSNSDSRQNAKECQDVDFYKVEKMRKNFFLLTNLYDWLLREASKEYLNMHHMVQEMGRNIVFRESARNVGRRSRLWSLEDIDLLLKGDEGTRNVQSIVLDIQQSFEASWHPDCFSNMQNLRLLDLSKVHLLCNLNSLPGALKFLRWDNYALESLLPIDQLHKLESLQLCNSKIRKLWNGAPFLGNLGTVDLSESEHLTETPDFSGTPSLKELLLNGCRNLAQVHESVGQLKNLVKLSLQHCRNLVTLPSNLETNHLEEFILGECLMLEELPKFGIDMKSLYFFDMRGTGINEIPSSILHLTSLKYLDLTFCSKLKSIPELPSNLIICANNCPWLKPASALPHLYASRVPKAPIHLFYDFQLWTRIPTWFEWWEYCWGKDDFGEFVTITADIPRNIADSNGESWGIAVCVVFQFLSQAWLGFSINWKFQDDCHPNKTKIHGTPIYYAHDCRVYVGFFPFAEEECRQRPSDIGSQLDLTLCFPTSNITSDLHDLEIMGCGWRLACKKDFDEWGESREPSPPRHDFLKRKSNDDDRSDYKDHLKKIEE